MFGCVFGSGFRRSLQKDWWLSHPLFNLPVSSCLFCIDEVSREKGPQYLGLFGMVLLHCFVCDSPDDALLTSFYQRISFLIGWDFVFFHGYHGSGWFRSTAERLWFLHFTLTVLKSSAGLAAIWNEVWNLNVCNLSPRVATDISIYISIYFTYVFHFQTFIISHRCFTCSWFKRFFLLETAFLYTLQQSQSPRIILTPWSKWEIESLSSTGPSIEAQPAHPDEAERYTSNGGISPL